MTKLRVAFQGELGAFSQQAIEQFYGRAGDPIPYQRFDQAFAALSGGDVDAAALPMENTLHGSVHENYDLLLKHDVGIVAETNVRIVHNLIVRPDSKFPRIRRVASHPVALNQCLDFFAKHKGIQKVVHYDTAGSVKRLMQEGTDEEGAIASELAAKIYGGKIIKRSIEDDRRNFTRFFLLELASKPAPRPKVAGRKQWKTSLVFTTRNVPGSLFRTLGVFALRDLSLAKIESRPLRGKPWEYLFYVDLLASADDPRLEKALGHLAELSDFQRVLGSYFLV